MARATRYTDRMSDADAVLWNIESDPALRSTILSVWVLDRAPDWERFSAKLERCVREIPRLRQRPVQDPLDLAPPRWEEDPHFDIRFHLRRLRATGDGSLRSLLDVAQPIGMQAFDRDRPLWELYIVDGLADGRTGMILKLHHAVSDGVGLVRMTQGMIERSRDAADDESAPLPTAPAVSVPDDWQRIREAASHRFEKRLERLGSTARAVGSAVVSLAKGPVETLRTASAQIASVARLLEPATEPMSPIMRGRSLSVHYEPVTVPLAELKRAAKTVGGTVNDAFVAAVTGGLRRYHEHLGEPVEALRMNMPINMRSGEKAKDAGNQFAPVRFAVPVSIADPAERICAIRELVAVQRSEPALPWIEPISAAIGSLPGDGTVRLSGSMMKAIDFTTSNVPGPRFATYVSGAKIEHMFGFGPLAGAAVNVTCFSYDGELGIGVNVDPAAVSDPALFVECLRKGFDEVLSVI